ncbi:hypothetical protein SDC9_101584 [bioreactor metagenome]|uniref:Uncharacterized protein n=1 Tax=bioreactor metagenome TaxID=1076179 RepID=A0A645AZ62_9ZZZZ
MSARWGTRSPIRLKSPSARSTSASWAIASRCSTALVEPPSAISRVMAFSNASRVRMSRTVMPCRSRSTTASPERWAYVSRRRSAAGGAAEPGSDMPSASASEAIVLAVYIPPQAPSPGQMARSIASRSVRLSRPAWQAPAASNPSSSVTSRSVPSLSRARPGAIEPAYRNTAARSSRAAAISMPGSDLSQPASRTEPSSRSADITVSTESATSSRDTSE